MTECKKSTLKNRNCKDIQDNFIKEKETQELLFDLYINKKYYYCGGNSGKHLRYFRCIFLNKKTPKYPDDAYCYVCGRSLLSKTFKDELDEDDIFFSEPSRIFYIYDIRHISNCDNYNIYIIGRCCLNRFLDRFDYKNDNKKNIIIKSYSYKLKIE